MSRKQEGLARPRTSTEKQTPTSVIERSPREAFAWIVSEATHTERPDAPRAAIGVQVLDERLHEGEVLADERIPTRFGCALLVRDGGIVSHNDSTWIIKLASVFAPRL